MRTTIRLTAVCTRCHRGWMDEAYNINHPPGLPICGNCHDIGQWRGGPIGVVALR